MTIEWPLKNYAWTNRLSVKFASAYGYMLGMLNAHNYYNYYYYYTLHCWNQAFETWNAFKRCLGQKGQEATRTR